MGSALPASGREPRTDEKKHILLTGATGGIGYATARRLIATGHRVTITSRVAARAASAAEALRRESGSDRARSQQLDLCSFADIRKGGGALLDGPPFDVVVHNAGIIIASPKRSVTGDGLEECLQCHAVGPMLLMAVLGPGLARPSRMIAVSSGLHVPNRHGQKRRGQTVLNDLDDPSLYAPGRAYKTAKLAQLWFVMEWERRFGKDGLHADAVCPGFVPTTAARQASGFRRFLLGKVLPTMPFATTLDQASKTQADWCLTERDTPGGRYFDGRRLSSPSEDARDPQQAANFWEKAEGWIGQRIVP